jgi:hypothetical protein
VDDIQVQQLRSTKNEIERWMNECKNNSCDVVDGLGYALGRCFAGWTLQMPEMDDSQTMIEYMDSSLTELIDEVLGSTMIQDAIVKHAKEKGLMSAEEIAKHEANPEAFEAELRDELAEMKDAIMAQARANPKDFKAFVAKAKFSVSSIRHTFLNVFLFKASTDLDAFAMQLEASVTKIVHASLSKIMVAFEEGSFFEKLTDLLSDLERIINRWTIYKF